METIFQSPASNARLPSCNHHNESCFTGPSCAKAGKRLFPGAATIGMPSNVLGRAPPASSSIVGRRSMRCDGVWRNAPWAEMPRGQLTISGVEMPPSCTQVLWRRNGVFARLDQPGPMLRKVAALPGGADGLCPSPRTIISALAPLSDMNMTSVLSLTPILRICPSTPPIS